MPVFADVLQPGHVLRPGTHSGHSETQGVLEAIGFQWRCPVAIAPAQ